MKWYKSFQVRIFVILILFIYAVLVSALTYTYNSLETELETDVFQTNMEIASSMRTAIDLHSDTLIHTMNTIADFQTIKNQDHGSMDEILQKVVINIPIISQIYVTDSLGMQIYKSSFPETMGDRSDRIYFQRAIQGEAYYSDALISRSTDKLISVIAVPIHNNGDIVGTLGASIDLGYLSELVDEVNKGSNGHGYIVDRTGHLIAHPDEIDDEDLHDISELTPVKNVISGETGSGRYMLGGVEELVSYVSSEKTGWGYIVQVPTLEAFESLRARRVELNVLLATLLGSVLIVAYPMAIYISRPIQEILKVLRGIGEYEYAIDFEYKRTDDLGLIQSEIVNMARELKITHEELEARVEERTTELNASNDSLQETLLDLQRTQEKLVIVERFAALSDMGIRMSHEINTPIGNSIFAASFMEIESLKVKQLLSENKMTKDIFTDYVESNLEASHSISTQLKQVNNTISSFKDKFSGESLLEVSEMCLLDEVQSALRESKLHDSHMKVDVDVDCAENICTFYHANVFDQILVELINNSLEYAFKDVDRGRISIKVSIEEDQILIKYSDDGVGIPMSKLNTIFEPFQKTSMSDSGSGIGLSHIYNLIVNLVGGKISCISSLGEGTVFEIELPLKKTL